MDSILEIADKYKLKVIEDGAQSFGAEYKNKKLGTVADAGCASFFPSKNLGAYGDGGMVFTDNKEIADKVRKLRVHGSDKKYVHDLVGYNSRLDSLQAAIVRVKLKYIDQWNDLRIKHAEKFNELFSGSNIATPYAENYNKHIYHLYTILIDKRDECREFLNKKGIASAVHYPIPVHLQNSFKYLGYSEKDLPVSHTVSQKTLSLPMFPELEEKEINYVAEMVKGFFK